MYSEKNRCVCLSQRVVVGGGLPKGKEVKNVKKTIYHPGKEEGEYRVLELEKNDKGEIYLRIRHGKKGEKENAESLAMRVGYDELAGMSHRLEKMLLFGGYGKATLYHPKEEENYKVGEVEINDKGEIFFRMTEGKKGEKESRKLMSMRLNEDELAGFWMGIRRALLS